MTRASLFTYPCLMAADILLYGASRVPVGGDQDQHVELARDLAVRFNRTYGETFVVPELHRAATAARVRDLAHPTGKMSKSDAGRRARGDPDARLPRRGAPRKVMRAVTDSGTEVRHDPEAVPGRHQPARDPRRLHRRRPARPGGRPRVVRRPEAGRRGGGGRGAGPRAAPLCGAGRRPRPRSTGSSTRAGAGRGGRVAAAARRDARGGSMAEPGRAQSGSGRAGAALPRRRQHHGRAGRTLPRRSGSGPAGPPARRASRPAP